MSSITKQFLQQKEARSLLNLGFDEPCIACYNYNNKKKLLFLEEPQTNSELHEYVEDLLKKELEVDNGDQIENFNQIESMFAFTTPTFAQAFDWIREKYNIDVYIQPVSLKKNSDSNTFSCKYIHCIRDRNCNSVSTFRHVSNQCCTYEKAQLQCLKKVIKHVKDNYENDGD
jgi:hypothetical protein